LNPLLREPSAAFRLVNIGSGAEIATSVTGAFDSATRRRGLLGRDAMAAGEALIIAPSNAIHTFFMRFDIDVAFVRRDGRIVKLRQSMPPWRLAFAIGAFAVVETPAGAFSSAGTAAGDTVALVLGDAQGR
jgi:uncharacterized membrane protein (UPF0127 family)